MYVSHTRGKNFRYFLGKKGSIHFATLYTAILRKVVGKNVHATIPKGNMGYDQYTVPDDCSCRTYFSCFPLALANNISMAFRANSFKFL